ncbi:MAG: M48 family metallopeptidase [Kordiimonas sp.]
MNNHLARIYLLLTIVVSLVGFSGVSFAQEAEVAGQPFDVAAATEEYLATVSGEQREKSDAYFEGGYWLILWGFLYGVIVAFVLLRKGLSAKIRDWCKGRSNRAFIQTFIYGGFYVLATSLLTFPWVVYTGFIREHQYELATQGFGAWFGEQLISLLISIVMVSLFIAVIYALIRKFGEKWWLLGAGVTAIFMMVAVMIAPVFIAPLFNEYKPLENSVVADAVLKMAQDVGADFDTVYVVDASAQSTRISANVSGLGATKRVSLNDNLLNQGSLAEVKAVMGHELGHYMLNHGLVLVASFTFLLGLGYLFVTKMYIWAIRRWGAGWKLEGLDDIAGLPLAVAIFSVYTFLMTPAFNSIIRINESQADAYGLEVAMEPDGFASISMKLAQYRKLDPGYIEEIIFFDHPSGRTRVEMSMEWKAKHMAARDQAD